MSDITKCRGEHCECRYSCFRYTAPIVPRQSYFTVTNTDGDCKYFLNNNGGKLDECRRD